MNKLLYSLFISIFLFDYLSLEFGLSRFVTYIPELLSMITMLIILARVTVGYGKNFPPIASFFLVLFCSNIIVGVGINNVSGGPLIAGIRTYLKYTPFFILPFVYHFSNEQISKQLKLLLCLFIIQTPVALYQRFVVSRGLITGDYVKGTIGGSGQLTVILVCAIAILLTFYLAKKINFMSFIVVFSILFIPMTMNETKVTIVLLPLALILPIYFSSAEISLKQFIPLLFFIALTGISFVFVYNQFVSSESGSGHGISDYLFEEGRAESYLYKGTEFGFLGKVGRIDAIVIAFTVLSENILHLLFGLGIGNVSESFVPELSGAYADKYRDYGVTSGSFTTFLWEIGILGIILYLLLFFMTFQCSKRLSIKGNFIGTFSNSWKTVTIIITIGTTYTIVFGLNSLSYLYWYFSGYIISENFRTIKI